MNFAEKCKKNIGQILAMLAVAVVLCCFVGQKEGYHIDELISFELSNAEYNPWIVPTQPVGRLAKFLQEEIKGDSFGETVSNLVDTVKDVAVNRGGSKIVQYKADVYPEPVWISGEQFHDYLTVDRDDAFNYFSVYFNSRADIQPPLFYMALHTMSSVFMGRAEAYVGCLFNVLAILGCCICFFKLGALLERQGLIAPGSGKTWGICVSILYGVSSGAIAAALLIRMYALMTLLCVLLFYLHLKKWLEKGFEKKNALLIMVTALGFWTQYFFLFYCITLAAVTTFLLFSQKRYGEVKKYIRSMVISAIVGVAAFPFALQDILFSDRGGEALTNFFGSLSAYGVRLSAFGRILTDRCFGGPIAAGIVLVCLAAALCTIWVRKGKEAVLPRQGSGALWLMLLVPVGGYFLFTAKMAPYLVDRYIMALFPFVGMMLALAVEKASQALQGKNRTILMLAPAILLGVFQIFSYDGEYLYRGYEKQLELARQYGELDCICVYDAQGYYYNLKEFEEYERTLLVTLEEFTNREAAAEFEELGEIVVLKKKNVEEEALVEALESYGWIIEKELLAESGSVHGDTVYLCAKRK